VGPTEPGDDIAGRLVGTSRASFAENAASYERAFQRCAVSTASIRAKKLVGDIAARLNRNFWYRLDMFCGVPVVFLQSLGVTELRTHV